MNAMLTRYRPAITLLAALLVGALLPWLLGRDTRWVIVCVGVVLGLCDWSLPTITQPLWQLLEKIGKCVGDALNLVFMALLYLLIFVPIGLVKRLATGSGVDAHPVAKDKPCNSFYVLTTEERTRKHFERPF